MRAASSPPRPGRRQFQARMRREALTPRKRLPGSSPACPPPRPRLAPHRPQPVGQRPRQVQYSRTLRIGVGARHHLADSGPLRRHARKRPPRHRRRCGLIPPPDRRRARRPFLPRPPVDPKTSAQASPRGSRPPTHRTTASSSSLSLLCTSRRRTGASSMLRSPSRGSRSASLALAIRSRSDTVLVGTPYFQSGARSDARSGDHVRR